MPLITIYPYENPVSPVSTQFLGYSGSNSISFVGVPEDPTRVIVMYGIVFDGVGNSISSPTINGVGATYGFNSGGGYRGFTGIYTRAVPTGTTVSASFSPGGGWDFLGIAVWVVYGVAGATPDLVQKSGAGTTHSFTSDYSAKSIIAFTDTWQGGSASFVAPAFTDFTYASQGTVRGGRVLDTYNTPLTINPNLVGDPYGETSFTSIAWK